MVTFLNMLFRRAFQYIYTTALQTTTFTKSVFVNELLFRTHLYKLSKFNNYKKCLIFSCTKIYHRVNPHYYTLFNHLLICL